MRSFIETPQLNNTEKNQEEEIEKKEEGLSISHEKELVLLQSLLNSNKIAEFYNVIKEEEYEKQLNIFKNFIKSQQLTFEEVIKLFQQEENNFVTRMAIIESLSEFKSKEDKENSLAFLCNFLKEDYEEDVKDYDYDYWNCESKMVSDYNYLFKSFLERGYDAGFDTQSDAEENYCLLKSAVIINMGKFGKIAENYILKLLEIIEENRKNYKKYNGFDDREQSYNKGYDPYDDSDEHYLNEIGCLFGYVDKREYDDFGYEISESLMQLSKIGSEKAIDYLIKRIDKSYYFLKIYFNEIKKVFNINKKYAANKLIDLISFLKYPADKYLIYQLVIISSDLVNVENTRDQLNQLIKTIEKKESRGALKYAWVLITPNHDKTAITNLQKFYEEKIKFEEYEINQKMNAREIALLKKLIGENEKVLEVGCGTGRLLLEMQKAGYDISGYDFTGRHVDYVKRQNTDAKVFRGDWHNNAVKDESLDTIYSLGRNILHDYSIINQVELFREAARVLKPGGKFIFDIPNREKGGYGLMVKEYAEEMKKRCIENFRYGTIYDSPDGKNFATRYAYGYEDIVQLTQISGFKIKEVKKETLETGKDDENWYFVLEKTERKNS